MRGFANRDPETVHLLCQLIDDGEGESHPAPLGYNPGYLVVIFSSPGTAHSVVYSHHIYNASVQVFFYWLLPSVTAVGFANRLRFLVDINLP